MGGGGGSNLSLGEGDEGFHSGVSYLTQGGMSGGVLPKKEFPRGSEGVLA